MEHDAGELRRVLNSYYVDKRKKFLKYATILQTDKDKCFNFAYNMSYAEKGAHRDSRSGGVMHRTKGQIFINTFQGKMAEFALYRYLKSRHIEVDEPDVSEYKLGKWDTFDLDCQGKHFSVKSTKSFGDLLLLETKDWNEHGQYIPNLASGTAKYDYTVLVRFQPDGEGLMRDGKLLYQRENEVPSNIRDILTETIYKKDWLYDFPGFIYHSELVRLINEKRIIPQNAMLNGKTKMDAENYYFQTGNMHLMHEIYTPNVKDPSDNKAPMRLKRKCPRCGKTLVLRHGYNWFWGCEGYFDNPRCEFREPMEL